MRHDKHSIIKIGTSTDWYFACMPLEYFFQNIATIRRKNCIKNIFYDFFIKNWKYIRIFPPITIYLLFLLSNNWVYIFPNTPIFFYYDYTNIYFSTQIFIKKISTWPETDVHLGIFISIALIGDCAKTIIETYELFCSLERCDI